MICACRRRKCRSQTSDKMDRWGSRGGKSQRRKEKRREEKRREEKRRRSEKIKSQNYKDQSAWKGACRKVGKHGSKSRLAKAAGAEPSGERRSEKLPAVATRSKFGSQNARSRHVRSTFGSWDVEKLHGGVAQSTCRSQNAKSTPRSDHFCTFRRRFAWQAQWIFAPCQKRVKRVGFVRVACSKTMARMGHLKKMCEDAFWCGRRSTRDIFIRDVRRSRSGRWFPENGCILEHQIFRFDKMILRDKSKICVTCPHFFTAGAVWIDGVEELQNALVRGRQLCTKLPIFEGSLAELLPVLDLSTITFEGSLEEFLRFRWMDRQTDR